MAEALRLTAVTPEQALLYWDVFADLLARSCAKSRGRDTVELCREAIESGKAVLWALHHEDGRVSACGLTEVQIRTNGKVCVIRQMAGSAMRGWLSEIESIREFGRLNGCNKVEFEGREGWGRVVPGVQRVGTIYEVTI